jgi:hypothetical protein
VGPSAVTGMDLVPLTYVSAWRKDTSAHSTVDATQGAKTKALGALKSWIRLSLPPAYLRSTICRSRPLNCT